MPTTTPKKPCYDKVWLYKFMPYITLLFVFTSTIGCAQYEVIFALPKLVGRGREEKVLIFEIQNPYSDDSDYLRAGFRMTTPYPVVDQKDLPLYSNMDIGKILDVCLQKEIDILILGKNLSWSSYLPTGSQALKPSPGKVMGQIKLSGSFLAYNVRNKKKMLERTVSGWGVGFYLSAAKVGATTSVVRKIAANIDNFYTAGRDQSEEIKEILK